MQEIRLNLISLIHASNEHVDMDSVCVPNVIKGNDPQKPLVSNAPKYRSELFCVILFPRTS